MSIAIDVDVIAEVRDSKSPDIHTLIDGQGALCADVVRKREAEAALGSWEATAERQAILLYLLGHVERALDILESEASHDWGKYFLGRALGDTGFGERAEEILANLFKSDKSANVGLPLARAQLSQNNIVDAEKTLKAIKGDSPAAKALLVEITYRRGDLPAAVSQIEALAEEHPDDRHVCFVLGIIAQAAGDDDTARHALERSAQNPPVAVDTLINLGTLYEDIGEWDLAVKCYETILAEFPRHPRARLFHADARASVDMYYDEDRERKEDKRMQILRTPVTDFELSVRSRNCLAKMKIDTLGDLISKSETELLSYKNFGETSLQEIKAILGSKNLRLGMGVDEALDVTTLGSGEDSSPTGDEKLLQSVDVLELSVRSRRALSRLGVSTVGQLAAKNEAELLGAPNFGQTSLNEIRQKLAEQGLSLAN